MPENLPHILRHFLFLPMSDAGEKYAERYLVTETDWEQWNYPRELVFKP